MYYFSQLHDLGRNMTHITEDRRGFERFDIRVPVKVSAGRSGAEKTLRTKNLSAAGGFFSTSEPMQHGQKVTVEMIMSPVCWTCQLTWIPCIQH